MRVLVTGHRGYVGSVLAGVLKHSGFDVFGADVDYFAGCDFGRVRDDTPCFECNVNELGTADLLSFDAVIHLAWLSGGGGVDSRHSETGNVETVIQLAARCREARVPRFIFMSTWEVYGRVPAAACDEGADTRRAGIACAEASAERQLLDLQTRSFRPIILRAAECYGVSPRLRLDTAINRWTAQAVTSGTVTVCGNGRSFRPMIHVEDLARACAATVSAPDEVVSWPMVNIAAPDQNLRLCEFADTVAEITQSVRHLGGGNGHHAHPDVRMDVGRFLRTFPRFRFRWSLDRGVAQLRDAMCHAGIAPSDVAGGRYDRRQRFQAVLEAASRGRSHSNLRCEPVHAMS